MAGDDDGIWVTIEEDGQVMRIDPATNEVVATIDTGREPRHVGLGFGSVWVTNFGSATISRIDPATNEVIATIEGGFGPEGIGFSDDSVWVANVRDGTVSRIDPETNKVVGTTPTGTATEGIVVDPEGLVYAAVTGALGVAGLDPVSGEVVAVFSAGNLPRRMIIRGDDLWVTNTHDATVQILDLNNPRTPG
jgi:YVTN family beta-propeller protein